MCNLNKLRILFQKTLHNCRRIQKGISCQLIWSAFNFTTFEGYSTITQSDYEMIDFVLLTNDNEPDLKFEYSFKYL
jgi:hypothetical protein